MYCSIMECETYHKGIYEDEEEEELYNPQKPDYCPLKEIPEGKPYDLISRSVLLGEINNFAMRITGSANAMAITIMEETKKSIANMINEQPAAFDLNELMQQLEEYIAGDICAQRREDCITPYCERCGAAGAIGIVMDAMERKEVAEDGTADNDKR